MTQVLVAVLKSPRDLALLLRERWYRIPLAYLPKRRCTYAAFYEPKTGFGKSGGRIRYYARISRRETKKRVELLPTETAHPRAHDDYMKFSFHRIEKLEKPVRNIIPRRVSFGFTSLKALRSARDILELYGVPPTERIIERGLRRIGIQPKREYRIGNKGKKYRIDLAIFCQRGTIAVECDNRKAHAGKRQTLRDKEKDAALCHLGWTVIRLTEKAIIERLNDCISRIQTVVRSLDGVAEV